MIAQYNDVNVLNLQSVYSSTHRFCGMVEQMVIFFLHTKHNKNYIINWFVSGTLVVLLNNYSDFFDIPINIIFHYTVQ